MHRYLMFIVTDMYAIFFYRMLTKNFKHSNNRYVFHESNGWSGLAPFVAQMVRNHSNSMCLYVMKRCIRNNV